MIIIVRRMVKWVKLDPGGVRLLGQNHFAVQAGPPGLRRRRKKRRQQRQWTSSSSSSSSSL